MPAQERHKTKYPGVYYIEGKEKGTGKPDRIFYIDYYKGDKRIQEKAGRQSQDMTPARANKKRGLRMAGRQPTNAETRTAEKAKKAAREGRWTIAKLWDNYCVTYTDNKGIRQEKSKFDLYLRNGLGKKMPADLLPLDVDRLRLALQKKGKRTQAARILEILRRTVNFGVRRGLVAPLTFKIEIPKLNNQTTEDLTPDQLRTLMRALAAEKDQTVANIMRLALFTGMRKMEILKLRWSDVDRQRGFITLRDPKGGPDQKIPLSEAASDVLDGITPQNENPHIFPGRFAGSHLTVIPRKSLNRIKRFAKLPSGFRPLHGLRHVYASMLASSGKVDLYTLQKLLTHKSPLMTQRYAHLRDETLKRASNLAGSIITEAAEAAKSEAKKVVKLKTKNRKTER